LAAYEEGAKKIPYQVVDTFSGADMLGIKYEQLLPWATPYQDAEKAFVVIPGDFVTTEDGTGIVHTAPTFGADDAMVAKDAGVPPMLILDENENAVPLVDLQGKFVESINSDLAGMYVKNEYYKDGEAPDKSADILISIQLKTENRAFSVAKYEHSYPHCWRTDKPILYYPLDSWFIKSTDKKDRMIELNKTINWKPASTGTGRFGNWLENLNDWNLSRSRYWGIPLPIWRTEDGTEVKCFGSIEELKAAAEKAVEAGFMENNPLTNFEVGNMDESNYDAVDLHKNFTDKLVFVSDSGKPMYRESDLIDVWFDSGSMPYAQWHYPFENKALIDNQESYPADYIAEGVDQTRGWFFTLHAIGTMVFDSVAYKNVISNGLVLDKNGQKMSKRLGNAVDPFETMDKYGADATRWYMITNAQPWDNLKFDLDGVQEVQRKFFGTLYNTYSFFALYANLDGFTYAEDDIALSERPEIDRWILSELNTLIDQVQDGMESFEPTRAFRPIQDFVTDKLSNWYVRLCRRRFWKGEYGTDKISAYQTLYTCLETVSRLASPLAPFFMEKLFRDLHSVTGKDSSESVHLSIFPVADKSMVDSALEDRMHLAQQISSMVLSLRKKEGLKVRQPLARILVPVLQEEVKSQLALVKDLILSEVNVKELEMVLATGADSVFEKNIKPNFKVLGPRFGKNMKLAAGYISGLSQTDIAALEQGETLSTSLGDTPAEFTLSDVEISTKDIPGMLVVTENGTTVALDITLNEELKSEGIARELINRIQNTRKDSGFEVTDRINIALYPDELLQSAVNGNLEYIKTETLANNISFAEDVTNDWIEFDGVKTKMAVEKV
jgi:isoleucyl-tRNA synthetase